MYVNDVMGGITAGATSRWICTLDDTTVALSRFERFGGIEALISGFERDGYGFS